ncbi:DUF669 domain-containing protein [Acidithiobacillus sp.]|uniref:DUF669 domain-containing protein n=1 Tax=Acidithiobacillus sp. TaxID=1872118 RepID=UPI003D03B07A
MAILDQEFVASELPEGRGDFEPIPAGWYTASIVAAEVKSTKDGTGEYIALRMDVLGPTHEGRVIFANLNIKNNSAKAEEIGRQQLGSVMRAIGLAKVRDSDQLIGGNLEIKVKIQKSQEYGDKNEVADYRAISGAPQKAAGAPAAAKGASLPWAKK